MPLRSTERLALEGPIRKRMPRAAIYDMPLVTSRHASYFHMRPEGGKSGSCLSPRFYNRCHHMPAAGYHPAEVSATAALNGVNPRP